MLDIEVIAMQHLEYSFRQRYSCKDSDETLKCWRICNEIAKNDRYGPLHIFGLRLESIFEIWTVGLEFRGYDSEDRNDQANLQLRITELARLFDEFCEEFAEQARD